VTIISNPPLRCDVPSFANGDTYVWYETHLNGFSNFNFQLPSQKMTAARKYIDQYENKKNGIWLVLTNCYPRNKPAIIQDVG
jgi:hypothetical protein